MSDWMTTPVDAPAAAASTSKPADWIQAALGASSAHRGPGYLDSRTGKWVPLNVGYQASDTGQFVPIDTSQDPGAMAANAQTPLQNIGAGYGAETERMGQGIQDYIRTSPSTGGFAANEIPGAFQQTVRTPMPAATSPDEKALQQQLFQNSPAAKTAAAGADFANTTPAAMIGGEAVTPIADAIKGVGMIPTMGRAAVTGGGQGFAAGLAMPADSLGDRLLHGTFGSLGGALLSGAGAGVLKAVPDLWNAAAETLQKAKGMPLAPGKIDTAVSEFLNANAKNAPGTASIPAVPGFKPTAAAANNDLGLYGPQAGLTAKGFGPVFQQQVGDNNNAIMTALRQLGPKQSQPQVSAAATIRLQQLNQAAKAPVQAAYAPFDAIKSTVHVPADTVVSPVDKVLNGMNSSERDMLPQPVLNKIFGWDGVVPINEIEGVRSALGDAAATAGPNGARVIRKVQGALDDGLESVQSIHNADGTMMAPIQGKAPLQLMRDARAANTQYRQQFPAQSSKNTPAQNFVAKAVTGKIPPTQVMDTALRSPENISALLKAGADAQGNPDSELLQLAQNHYVNKLFDASSNRAGGLADGQLLNGYAMRDFRAGNTDIEGQLFKTPQQRKLLDDIQNATIMNNNGMRRAMPGESGTNALGNEQDNMADFMRDATVAGLEHMVPGAGLASKALKALAGGSDKIQQLQFRARLAQALMDPALYQQLRALPQTAAGQAKAVQLLRGYPGLLGRQAVLTGFLGGPQPQPQSP